MADAVDAETLNHSDRLQTNLQAFDQITVSHSIPTLNRHETLVKLVKPPVWWSNSAFFLSVHLIGLYGAIFVSPITQVSSQTICLTILSWQLATFGITIGYHRLWSHRSFQAHLYLRWLLALAGCLGFQGSIRWWVLRHRLHHRFTDTINDPYNARRGLFFSHMGWIFRKPHYDKLKSIDSSDLERDPVVRFQHRHYISLSIFMGFILPVLVSSHSFINPSELISLIIGVGKKLLSLSGSTSSSPTSSIRILTANCTSNTDLINSCWSNTTLINSAITSSVDINVQSQSDGHGHVHSRFEALIWVGFVSRLLIWHFTFFINSLAHYLGEQLYDLDITARSNFILAIFTGGEANHNYHHVFPRDYRNGPAILDWDPSKWIIYLIYRFTGLIKNIHYTQPEEIELARRKVLRLTSSSSSRANQNRFEELNLISSSSSSSSDYDDEDEEKAGVLRDGLSTSTGLKRRLNLQSSPDFRLARWKRSEVFMKLIETDKEGLEGLRRRTILLIDDYLVDVSSYLADHPGGSKLLRRYSIFKRQQEKKEQKNATDEVTGDKENLDVGDESIDGFERQGEEEEEGEAMIELNDCSDEFKFEFNLHSWPARQKMKSMRIAKVIN